MTLELGVVLDRAVMPAGDDDELGVRREARQLARVGDRDALVALLTENAWPFHTRPRVTRPEAEKAVDGGAWEDEDHRTFWIEHP